MSIGTKVESLLEIVIRDVVRVIETHPDEFLHHLQEITMQQLCHPPRLKRRNPDTEGTSLETSTAAQSQAVAA